VVRGERGRNLSPKEFDLLAYLMMHAQAGSARAMQIISAVWGDEEYLDQRTVDVHVRWLRQKVEDSIPRNPRHLLTVRGVGYKFVG
jgi:DNA-binding response OmpR family regulator